MVALPVTFSLEPRFKEQFADFMTAGFSPFIAAMKIWPNDAGLASQVSATWPNDPYVLAYLDNKREAETSKVEKTTKLAQLKRIEERLPMLKPDDWLKAERLIAEISGHIEKAAPPSVTVNNQQNVIERVVAYKDHGDDDNWENRAIAQQRKLIEGSRL